MKFLISIFFAIFLTGAITAGAHAQANSLKQISFVIDRYSGGYQSTAKLVGDNIDVNATVWQQTAPNYCWFACRANDTILLWGPDDSVGLKNASGTIDGIFYPTLYIFHTLQYSVVQAKIPKLFTKTVRISAPMTLTGNFGIWRTEQEVGDYSRALYLHNGINFQGRVKLILRVGLNGDARIYRDKYISFDFAAAE